MIVEEKLRRVSDEQMESLGFVFYLDFHDTVLKADAKPGAKRQHLLDYLQRHGYVGLDKARTEEAVRLLDAGQGLARAVVVQGKAPRMGEDGRPEFAIDMSEKRVEVKDEKGAVDYRDLNLIKEIKGGEKILRILPPTPGEDGVSVEGKAVAAQKGEAYRLRLGANVRQDQDTIYATADGHVVCKDNVISVYDEFVVNGDVDYRIGNLSFLGALRVNGSVISGFSLKSGRSIHVTGTATECTLEAAGDITVDKGIFGNGKCRVSCEGKLKAHLLNDVDAYAGKGVEVTKEIIRSRVKTMGRLLADLAEVRGGEVCAFEGMAVKELGAPSGAPTRAVAGLDLKIDGQIREKQAAMEQLDGNLAKLSEALAPFAKNPLLYMKAPPDKKAVVDRMKAKVEEVKAARAKLEAQVTELEIKRYSKDKTIEVRRGVLQDVEVQIGNKRKLFKDGARGAGVMRYDRSTFEITYRP